jgi:SAM-dependent methyltransferase
MHGRYSAVDRFGHRFAAKTFVPGCRTLDVGAGNGAHLKYERLDEQAYVALEMSELLARQMQESFPGVSVVVGDCQEKIQFQDNYFDRVLAIHILEHLDNLPRTLDEIRRVLRRDGKFSVVIPCEGGRLYQLGRRFSSQRMFEKRYHQSYDWLIKYDHVNTARDVLYELDKRFKVEATSYFPFLIPVADLELVIGLTCVPKK